MYLQPQIHLPPISYNTRSGIRNSLHMIIRANSPMAFIHSWLPRCERTVPPTSAACARSFSINVKRRIVSSPLKQSQRDCLVACASLYLSIMSPVWTRKSTSPDQSPLSSITLENFKTRRAFGRSPWRSPTATMCREKGTLVAFPCWYSSSS